MVSYADKVRVEEDSIVEETAWNIFYAQPRSCSVGHLPAEYYQQARAFLAIVARMEISDERYLQQNDFSKIALKHRNACPEIQFIHRAKEWAKKAGYVHP